MFQPRAVDLDLADVEIALVLGAVGDYAGEEPRQTGLPQGLSSQHLRAGANVPALGRNGERRMSRPWGVVSRRRPARASEVACDAVCRGAAAITTAAGVGGADRVTIVWRPDHS